MDTSAGPRIVVVLLMTFHLPTCVHSESSTPEETLPPQTVETISPPQTVGATTLPMTIGTTSPPQTVGKVTTTGTVPVGSSIPPTNNPPRDGTTTTSVIIVVAVVIILVVIVVGVVIVMVLFRAKKRKQQLVINKFQSVTTENEDFEMKLKQKGTIENKPNLSADQPPYTEIQTEAPPNVPIKSEELVDYLNQNNPLTGEYSEIELEPADSKHALPAKPPRQVNLSDPISEAMQSSRVYHDVDQHPSTTNVQEADIYTVPGITNSHTVEIDSTVYSEPIQPSLFTDAVGSPSDSEDLQPYAPIYTVPINLPKGKKVLLKVFGSNIREIRELGMGQFGKVILAETVGLSAKDLRLSESDDDKSKSTLVAVKKLKSGAPSTTKEAFEKEVNFMSRLTDKNVIRILGVCYEDTPFIMMEYMAKGDLNQYLQKFKTLSTNDSEPQGHITTKTLVYMTTQIVSAMKYLVSHNFVHRDLATRNCLVGPNYLVKISDFGMSRSLYDSHYYRIHGRFALPVRWMAYECFYGKFSQKSDVWAFGVTMWEIFTLAKEQPYNDMSDKQVVEDALKASTPEETLPPQTVGATSPPQTVETPSPPQTVETTSPPQTVETPSPPQTVETTSPPQTVGATTLPMTIGTTSPPQTVGNVTTTGTLPVGSSTQPTNNSPSDGATTTLVIIVVAVVIILVVIVVGAVILVVLFRAKKRKQQLVINKFQSVTTERKDIELKLKQVQNTEREANSRPDQSLYHMAVIQKEVSPSASSKSEDVKYLSQNSTLCEDKPVPTESEYALPAKPAIFVNLSNPMFEELESNPMYQSMDRRHDPPSTTNEREANSRHDHHMAVVQKVVPSAPSRSEEGEYLNQNSPLSEYNLLPAESEYALPAKPPRLVNLSKSMFEELESNPMYQSMDRCHDPPSTTNVSHGNDMYTVPDTTSSTTIETQSGIHETAYSKPIQPSLFTDAPRNPLDSEYLQPCAPQSCKNIYCNAGHTTPSS